MYKKNEEERNEIKIIIIGNSGVGKTNLVNAVIGLEFQENDIPTISGSFFSKRFTFNDKVYTANIWDTAGQEAYKGITQLFFRGSEIVILVYDICSLTSFKALNNWYELCEDTINNEHIYAIVGNKNDLYLNSEVNEKEAKAYADSKNIKFKLVSAKTNPKGFIDFVEELIMDYKKITNNIRRQTIKIQKNDVKLKKEEKCLGCNKNAN